MLANLKIGPRLMLGFGSILVLLLISVGVALSRMSVMAEDLTRIVKTYNVEQNHAIVMELEVQGIQRYMRTLLLSEDSKEDAHTKDQIAEARKKYDEASGALEKMVVSNEAKATFASIVANREKGRAVNNQVMALEGAGRVKEATSLLLNEGRDAAAAWIKAQEDMVHFLDVQMDKKYDEAEEAYQSAKTMLITLALVALAAGIGVAIVITRSIANPLESFRSALSAVANGDLRQEIQSSGQDEVAQMGEALNLTILKLRESMVAIQDSAATIATASAQISGGNSDLSRRTEQQAASLEETASSIEEFTATTNQTAQNAGNANRNAAHTRTVAAEGAQRVSQLVASMGDINQSANRIAEIIGVVDEIAFQTNLLALNAAVEAARAGEQGRGFAVVASEVRNLAKRSADAAKEIKGLIRDSVTKASDGAQIAAQAGKTMGEVVENVQKVTDLIQEIATASQEQSRGIAEINRAITQMDTVTQQNAALVEEAAAAAESLDEQAQSLSDLTAQFNTGTPARTQSKRSARPTPTRAPARQARARSAAPPLRAPAKQETLGLKPPINLPASEDEGWETF